MPPPILGGPKAAPPPSLTMCHRAVRSKGRLLNKTAVATIFRLAEAADEGWRRLDGQIQLPKVIFGVTFTEGIKGVISQSQAAAA